MCTFCTICACVAVCVCVCVCKTARWTNQENNDIQYMIEIWDFRVSQMQINRICCILFCFWMQNCYKHTRIVDYHGIHHTFRFFPSADGLVHVQLFSIFVWSVTIFLQWLLNLVVCGHGQGRSKATMIKRFLRFIRL